MGLSPVRRPLDITSGVSEAPSVLEQLSDFVKSDLEQVNALILKEMQSEIHLIPQLAAHLIAAGGKRIRPLLTLAGAQLCGYRGGDAAIQLAACVEFIHTATLLHDDVVDESNMRRGKPSANAVFGNQASILVGDFLFARAFEVMVRVGNLEALALLSKTAATLAEGEVMQLVDHGNLDIVEQRYLDIVQAKTGSLFHAACAVGAILAPASPQQKEYERALGTYGNAFGICFQIIDDVLDYAANESDLGKSIGDDFKEGKVTLPVIYAYQQGASAEKIFWESMFEKDNVSPEDLTQAQSYLLAHDALGYACSKAQIYGLQAKKALKIFPESDLKTVLLALVDFCTHRGF